MAKTRPPKLSVADFIDAVDSETKRDDAGKACIYVNKLSDINEKQLTVLMKKTVAFLKSKYD